MPGVPLRFQHVARPRPDYIRPGLYRIKVILPPISGKISPIRTDYSFVAKAWRLWELEISDLELVHKAAKGDHGAFHALVDRHAKNLFRVALSLSATRADAEDLVQETYAGAYKSL